MNESPQYVFPVLKLAPSYAEMLLSGRKAWEFRRHQLPTHTAMLMHDGAAFVGLVVFDMFVRSNFAYATWSAVHPMPGGDRLGGVTGEMCEERGWKFAFHVRRCSARGLPRIVAVRLPRASGGKATIELPDGTRPFMDAIDYLFGKEGEE